MDFLSDIFSVKIHAVLQLDWEKNDVYVPPRPYGALSIRIKGNAVFSDENTRLSANDMDILYMPAGVGYHLTSGAEQLIVVHFEVPETKQNYFEVFSPSNAEAFLDIFTTMNRIWQQKKPGYYLRCTGMLYKLLEMLLYQGSTPPVNGDSEKIKPALRHIHENYRDSQLTVADLCQLLGISDTYFRKLFFRVYSTTPNRYINELRITYAEELLYSGYYTVEEVAERVGFSDSKYFSTVFKKLRGYPPRFIKPNIGKA
jgi:AraC-like DNA-binding protein